MEPIVVDTCEQNKKVKKKYLISSSNSIFTLKKIMCTKLQKNLQIDNIIKKKKKSYPDTTF